MAGFNMAGINMADFLKIRQIIPAIIIPGKVFRIVEDHIAIKMVQ